MIRMFAPCAALLLVAAACSNAVKAESEPKKAAAATEKPAAEASPTETQAGAEKMPEKLIKADSEWETCLTPEQYRILREKGTERAFTGKYYNHHEKGVYTCAACGQELFASDTKFDSGTGWPSYWQPVDEKAVETEIDKDHGMVRTEALCSKCGGHLGHVFPDGPKPTGLRYCINSGSLSFKPADESKPDAAPEAPAPEEAPKQ